MPRQPRTRTAYAGVFYFQDPDGRRRWVIVYYHPVTGKLVEERVRGARLTAFKCSEIRARKMKGTLPTNKEAVEAERRAVEAAAERPTFRKLWELFEANVPLRGMDRERTRFKLHIAPIFGEMTPEEVEPLAVDRWRIELQKGRRPATVARAVGLLRRLSSFAVERGLSVGMQFRVRMPPRANDNAKMDSLSETEVKSLLAVLKTWEDREVADIMALALHTGMRRSELLKLRWHDLDFEKHFIRLEDVKSGQSTSVPMSSQCRRILEGRPREGDTVFSCGHAGQPDLTKRARAVMDAAGVPRSKRPLHSLRVTFASMLISSGKVDLYQLQKLLNHRTPTMTQRYAHLRDAALRRASDIAGELLKDASDSVR